DSPRATLRIPIEDRAQAVAHVVVNLRRVPALDLDPVAIEWPVERIGGVVDQHGAELAVMIHAPKTVERDRALLQEPPKRDALVDHEPRQVALRRAHTGSALRLTAREG